MNSSANKILPWAIAATALAAAFYLSVNFYRLANYGKLGEWLFDDAFFFVRYAGNFLDTGRFEWNRGEGPVYGNTSQLYQLLVTLLHWLLDRNIVLTLTMASTLGAVAYLFVLPLAYAAARPRIDPSVRLMVMALIVVFVACDGQIHFIVANGMETSWAMTMVALSLLATFRLENADSKARPAALNAVAILLVFMTRPDAVVLALAAPAGLVVFCRDRDLRRAGLMALLGGAALVAAFIGLCWLYYGDPLPLAATTKTALTSILPTYKRIQGLGDPVQLFEQTLLFHKVEVGLAVVALAMFFRLPAALRGATLGMVVFATYHLFFVLPVMGHFGRFYAPMMPVLMLLAACAAEAIVEAIRRHRWSARIGIAAIAVLAVLIAHRSVRLGEALAAAYLPTLAMDGAMNAKHAAEVNVAIKFWYYDDHLPALVAALGDDCSAASTENGILSALARRAPMVDMSSLHDRRMVREGFSATRLLEVQKPDVLIRPYPWYVEWIAALENHPALDRDYIREGPSSPGKIWIAFRRDSACAARVRKTIYGR